VIVLKVNNVEKNNLLSKISFDGDFFSSKIDNGIIIQDLLNKIATVGALNGYKTFGESLDLTIYYYYNIQMISDDESFSIKLKIIEKDGKYSLDCCTLQPTYSSKILREKVEKHCSEKVKQLSAMPMLFSYDIDGMIELLNLVILYLLD
jgi:hypothetical protein